MSFFQGINPFDQLSPAVKKLIVANVGIFLLQKMLPFSWVDIFSLTPLVVLKKGWVWQLVTYSFLHGGGWHLFFNMLALWMVGPHIEWNWGTKNFLIYYGACILGAAVTQFFVAPTQVMVGASGGIYGLLIAFGLLYPDTLIYLFFIFPMKALQAIGFIALLTLVFAFSPGESQVAHFAHLGGMGTGLVYIKWPGWRQRIRLWSSQTMIFSSLPNYKLRKSITHEEDLSVKVDRILEKISSQGVDSLTREEHETMQRYAKKRK